MVIGLSQPSPHTLTARTPPKPHLLSLQLVAELHLGQPLLVEQDQVACGVVGGDVGQVEPSFLQLLEATELRGAEVQHAGQGGHPHHLAWRGGGGEATTAGVRGAEGRGEEERTWEERRRE